MNSSDNRYNVCVQNPEPTNPCGAYGEQAMEYEVLGYGQPQTGIYCKKCVPPMAYNPATNDCQTGCTPKFTKYNGATDQYECVPECTDTQCALIMGPKFHEHLECIDTVRNTAPHYFRARDTGYCVEQCDATNITAQYRICENAGTQPYCPTVV